MQTPVTRFPCEPRRAALAANPQVLQCLLSQPLLLLRLVLLLLLLLLSML